MAGILRLMREKMNSLAGGREEENKFRRLYQDGAGQGRSSALPQPIKGSSASLSNLVIGNVLRGQIDHRSNQPSFPTFFSQQPQDEALSQDLRRPRCRPQPV